MHFGIWTILLAVAMLAGVAVEAYRAPRTARRLRDSAQAKAGDSAEAVDKQRRSYTTQMWSSLIPGVAFTVGAVASICAGDDRHVALWLIFGLATLAIALIEFVSRRILMSAPASAGS
jgi:Flp pilus assembly protein TadB